MVILCSLRIRKREITGRLTVWFVAAYGSRSPSILLEKSLNAERYIVLMKYRDTEEYINFFCKKNVTITNDCRMYLKKNLLSEDVGHPFIQLPITSFLLFPSLRARILTII